MSALLPKDSDHPWGGGKHLLSGHWPQIPLAICLWPHKALTFLLLIQVVDLYFNSKLHADTFHFLLVCFFRDNGPLYDLLTVA